jgi:hypothetical protein
MHRSGITRRRSAGPAAASAIVLAGALLALAAGAPAAVAGVSASEPSHSPAPTTNPCRYVTAAQAAKILRVRSVSESEAPLGPTCIFKAKGTKVEVTLAVEVLRLKAELHAMKNVSRTKIAGRTTYCGKLGSSLLLAPVTSSSVLVVTAPCGVARSFASIALSHIES